MVIFNSKKKFNVSVNNSKSKLLRMDMYIDLFLQTTWGNKKLIKCKKNDIIADLLEKNGVINISNYIYN